MGNYHMSIKNETPDYYSYCYHYHPEHTEGIVQYGVLGPYARHEHNQREILTSIYVRYGRESKGACRNNPMLRRKYNGIYNYDFTIRPRGDMVQLCASAGGDEPWCENLGERKRRREREERERQRQEEERRRREAREFQERERREEAERQRREKIERERRLQEERRRRQEEERRRRERIERERRRQEEERRRREEERRRREEEERRRRERIEREKRIQAQIAKEADALKNKLGRAGEKRRLNTNLTGRERQHQRSHVLAQTVEDDAAGITYEEEKIVTEGLQKLLETFNVQVTDPTESMYIPDVSERIKLLYDQLISSYCAEADLQIWFHSSFDEATQFTECSLTDKLDILEALLRVTLNGENEDLVLDIRKEVTVYEKHALLIRLMASLMDCNRTLSCHLLHSCLDAFGGLLKVNREYIESIVFNNIWTPLEAIIFLLRASNLPQNDLTLFLHIVRTYGIQISDATTALKSDDRMAALKSFIDDETDKPLATVIDEMKHNGVPETILEKVRQVVENVLAALPNCKGLDISSQIEEGIKAFKETDVSDMDVPQLGKILTGLCIGVHEEMHYFPRVTQLVSLLTLLLSKTPDLNGCLLEISTGEGKSCIVAMLAVLLAQKGNVDIVTSSPLLAIRDAEEWGGYFAKFGLKASAAVPIGLSKCKSPDEMDAMLATAYRSNIVYGTVGNFAADTLRQEFEKKNIRGNRGFDAIIVDEVDYMTLDNGVQVTFLSHASSGMRHVEQVLASIWSMVCASRPVEDSESGETFWFTAIQHMHKATISALVGSEANENFNAWEVLKPAIDFGYVKLKDFKNLILYEKLLAEADAPDTTKEHSRNQLEKIMNQIGVAEARDILTVLEAALDDVAFECYTVEADRVELFGPKSTKSGKIRMLLLDNGLASELLTEKELVDLVKKAIGEKIQYSHEFSMPTKENKDSDGMIYIPQFLKPYLQNRLEIFIKNALKAIVMTKGREYTIDRSASENSTEENAHHFDCIIPVDFKASGVLEKNKRWGDGLQEFLEMKHQLALTPLSTVTNYLSNFHFFKRYTNGSGVYGVSGTLGDESDCAFLAKHFKVSCYPIPTHKRKKLIEIPMVQIEGGEDKWIENICERTKVAISAKHWCKGQAALVVCEDLKTATKLQKALGNIVSDPDKITMYTRSDKHTVEGMDFGPGHVVIATNLGGRGTDVSVTSEVNDSGGLFVLLSHFPSNRRVEKQIFGRTARKGQPGTAQMVLNYHKLACAYQGQNIDMMRQLRQDYERQRIIDMESDELLTIDIRENLFELFCQRLSTVTGLYGDLERQGWGSLMVRDMPKLLEALDNSTKMDCKAAQNAFKETWAEWLILNEHRIEENEDVEQLMQDLNSVLDKRQEDLVQCKSHNFYDHTRQALGRMYLHEKDHEKDCGTLAAWNRAIEADNSYKAIAIYNKAYIVINMRKDGYLQQAIDLLKETIQCIDVHVAENANTLMACHLSSAHGKFEPHHQDETNFKRQLEIRNSFFKMWLDYTGKAIEKLQKLKDDGENAITEEKGIFALIEKPNHLEANELQEFFNEGLQVVYEVKKKPRFCIDALICAIIGLLQVFAGALVCVCSFGSATQIGLGLISEGVSDIVAGIQGMIQGSFSWADWAISKAISIGMSLISAGFSKIKDAACAVAKGVKGLLTGAKSLSSAWDDCMRAGKAVWKSTKSGFASLTGALSSESFKQSVTKLTTGAAIKQAGKYVVQEVVTQGVVKGLEVGVSKGTEALFEKLLSERFISDVGEGLQDSAEMNESLCHLIVCFGVPESTLTAENPPAYQIPSSNKSIIDRQIKDICEKVIPELTTDNAIITQIFSRLKEVKDEMEGILRAMDGSGKLFTAATIATELGSHTAEFVTMIQNIPTKTVMREKVVPEFTDEIEHLLRDDDAPKYKSDARSTFPTVLQLKEGLKQMLTEKVAAAFTDACASHLISFCTNFARSKLNKGVTAALHKTTGRYETKYFFQKKQEQYHTQKMQRDLDKLASKPLSEQDMISLASRVQKFENAETAPSVVELKALATIEQLGGKGLQIQTVDKDGTELSSVAFRGGDDTKPTIKLRVVREDVQMEGEKGFFAKMKESLLGKDSPWSGRFDLVGDDGTAIKLDTSEDNSLFYAVAKATHPELSTEEVKEKANFLRSEVGDEILKNPDKYAILHRRQQEYEAAYGEATFFKLPPKQGTGDRLLRRSDATVRELDRSDANVVDNSFTLTRMKISLEEKSIELWKRLRSGEKVFLMSVLKGSVSLVKNIATPVWKKKGASVKSITPDSEEPMGLKLLYMPSETLLQECNGKTNARFSQMAKQWSSEFFFSMVIPAECDDKIIASETGKLFGLLEEKDQIYEIYKLGGYDIGLLMKAADWTKMVEDKQNCTGMKLVTDCLCGTTEECNPMRLLKLVMICSHPDSTLAILTAIGLVKTELLDSDAGEHADGINVDVDSDAYKKENEEDADAKADMNGDEEKGDADADLKGGEGGGHGDTECKQVSEDQKSQPDSSLELEINNNQLGAPWGLSDEGLDVYFKMCYLVVLSKYRVADCLEEEAYQQLVTWVENDGFLNEKEREYVDILDALEDTV